jgi:hypothetical protein
MKYLIKSCLILLIIFFETMLCFAFAFNSIAMLVAVLMIFNAFLTIYYICVDLNINSKKDIDNKI